MVVSMVCTVVVSTVCDAVLACPCESVATVLSDGITSSFVFVVGGHVADPGMQPVLWGSDPKLL